MLSHKLKHMPQLADKFSMLCVFSRVIILLSIFTSPSFADEPIAADSKVCMHNSRYTQSVSDSLQGCINQDDTFTVNEYSEENKSAYVTATSGVSKGQSGWTQAEAISTSLQGQQAYENATGPNTQVRENAMDRAILDALAEGKAQKQELNQEHLTPRTDDEIWEGTSGENPRYKIALDRYDGGDYIPFYQDSFDEFGTRTRTYHYVRADSETALRGITRLSAENQRVISTRQSTYCQSGIHQTYSGNEGNWIPSCEVLQNQNLTPAHSAQLSSCALNIQKAITQNGSSRSSIFRSLYSKLNSREQEFAAMIFTSYGESGGENHADQIMVMKTLNNRARYAQEKGFREANELDAALQPWQFSMYNAQNGANWDKVLNRRDPSRPGRLLSDEVYNSAINKSVESYILYRNTEFSKEGTTNRIYHYLTPTAARTTSWVHQGTRVHPQVKNNSPTGHQFYVGVPWTFRYNNFRS